MSEELSDVEKLQSIEEYLKGMGEVTEESTFAEQLVYEILKKCVTELEVSELLSVLAKSYMATNKEVPTSISMLVVSSDKIEKMTCDKSGISTHPG